MNFLSASVEVNVDDSRLPGQLARAKSAVTRAVDRMKLAFSRMSTAFRAAWDKMTRYAKWAVLGIAAIATASIKMAADVIESENLYKESMGAMADATREWSKEMSKALYLNEFEVRKYVGTFNVMLLSMGVGEEKAAEMSKTMTQLTYDMASFYNLKTEEAFGKIQSSIVGMSRPLQALGILVKESTIEAYALRTGLIKEGQEMTELQKVMARYGTIMEATTKSQGDMLRTINESANVFRGLWAQVKLVAISFGDALLPAVTKVAKQMRDWLSENQQKAAEIFVDVIEDITLGIAKLAEQLLLLPAYWKSFQIEVYEAGIRVYELADAMTNLDKLFAWVRGDVDTFENRIIIAQGAISVLESEINNLVASYGEGSAAIRNFFDDLRRDQAKPDFITTFPPVVKYQREPFSWEKPPQKITALEKMGKAEKELLSARADAYRHIYGQMGRMTEEAYKAQSIALKSLYKDYENIGVAVKTLTVWYKEQAELLSIEYLKAAGGIAGGFQAAGMQIKREIKTWGERAYEFSMTFRDSIASGLEATMRDFDNWRDHLLNVFEEVYWSAMRIAFIEPIAGKLAGVMAGAVGGLLTPTAPLGSAANPFIAPKGSFGAPKPELQHGGTVLETGWAKVHKGETYSGVQGNYGRGNLEVHIRNEGSEKLEVSNAQEYVLSDRRIINVTTRAMIMDKRYQNSIKQASR